MATDATKEAARTAFVERAKQIPEGVTMKIRLDLPIPASDLTRVLTAVLEVEASRITEAQPFRVTAETTGYGATAKSFLVLTDGLDEVASDD